MSLDFLIIIIPTIFIAVPVRIFVEIGIDPGKVNIVFFILVWILLFSITKLVIIAVARRIKYMIQNFTKNLLPSEK